MDAVILAGGSAKRMGGADKPAMHVGNSALLARVADAVRGAQRIIVVGPARPEMPVDAHLTREHPPGSGPVAALAAGMRLVASDTVAVLAADLPFLTSDDIQALAENLDGDVDGAMLVDEAGRDQLLVGVWWSASIRKALKRFADPCNASMRRLVAGLDYQRVTLARQPPPWTDCDTVSDIEAARRLA
jgi:molybdopterin-guanine dinucleotide biosynthesis protein A